MTDRHLDTGAAALHALGPQEMADFQAHLLDCEPCRVEFDSFTEALGTVGASHPVLPPPGLREKVLAAAARTPQLPPLVAPTTDVGSAQVTADAGTTPTPGPVRSSVVDPATADQDSSPATARAARRWFARPTLWIAAAAVVAVTAVGTGLLLDREGDPVALGDCVAAADDVRRLAPTVGEGGDVEHSATCNALVIHVPAMPELPPGQVYQVWVMAGEDDARSMGVVPPAGGTMETPVVAGDSDVGVSIEPGPNGSEVPTADPIWVVPL